MRTTTFEGLRPLRPMRATRVRVKVLLKATVVAILMLGSIRSQGAPGSDGAELRPEVTGDVSRSASPGAPAETARTTLEMSMEDAVRVALRGNAELAVVRTGLELAKARREQAGRLAAPVLDSEYGQNLAGREGWLTVGFTQRFPLNSRLRAERRVSLADIKAAEHEIEDAERQVAERVRLLAIEWLARDAERQLRERQVRSVDELLGRMAGGVAAAEISKLEVHGLEMERRRLRMERDRVVSMRSETEVELRGWLGLGATNDVVIAGTLAVPEEETAGRELSLADRPDYRAAGARRLAAEEGVGVARSGRWEDIGVGLFGGVFRQEDAPLGLQDDRMVGMRVSVPLPIWGRSRGRTMEAAAQAARAGREEEAVAVRVRREVESARVAMMAAAGQSRELTREVLPRAVELEGSMWAAHREGQVSLAEAARARERRMEWELAALAAVRDYHLAKVRYESALGTPREETR